jgi:hypothetical protein
MPKKTKRSASGSIALMAVGGLLIVGAIALFLFMLPEEPAQPAAERVSNSGQADSVIGDNFPNVERISPQDARTSFDQGEAVILDVRTPEEYAEGHIAGAVLIPLLELPERVGELDPNSWIITY